MSNRGTAKGPSDGPRVIFGLINENWVGSSERATQSGEVAGDKESAKSDFASAEQPENQPYSYHLMMDAAKEYGAKINASDDNFNDYKKNYFAAWDVIMDNFRNGPEDMKQEYNEQLSENPNPVVAMESIDYDIDEETKELKSGAEMLTRTYEDHPMEKTEYIVDSKDGKLLVTTQYKLDDDTTLQVQDNFQGEDLQYSSIRVEQEHGFGQVTVGLNDSSIFTDDDQQDRFAVSINAPSFGSSSSLAEADEFIVSIEDAIKKARCVEYMANSLRK